MGDLSLTVDQVADLTEADHEGIRLLSLAVYPLEKVADWPGRLLQWSPAEWCVRLHEEGTLVSYIGVHVREAACDGRPVRVGGIGGVKTHPAARRRGLAGRCIRRAVEFFREAGVGFALLVCEPTLLDYYARLGWREFRGRVQVRQHGETADFTFNRVMTHGVNADGPTAGTIDLCGPAW
jgi:aminoglycoside 2'-N-acetyltransferase I